MNTARNRRILVIDDNEAIHDDFRKILRAERSDEEDLYRAAAELFGETSSPRPVMREDFEIDAASQGEEGLKLIKKAIDDEAPYALAFVDVRMPPGWDGIETISRIWDVDPEIQAVVCTAHSDYSLDEMTRRLGRTDQLLILKKPFDNVEVMQLANALTAKWELARRARVTVEDLKRMVDERTREILATRDVAVFALAQLAESRDPETGRHLERIRSYSHILADELSHSGPYTDQIDAQFLQDLYRASPLHDIGKVGIPDALLLKPGQLSSREFEIVKRHTIIGAEALDRAAHFSGVGGFLDMAADVARYHHERFDGTGYPEGLAGQQIPLPARIVALADVFDALCSARVYKAAFEPEVARLMIEEQSDKHFDPAVVEAFLARYDDFLAVAEQAEEGQLNELEPAALLDPA